MKKLILTTACLLLSLGIMYGQDRTVSGTVAGSEDGLPIIGATIVIKGDLSTGTITDFDGNYTIQASEADTLVVSYVGFTTREVPVNNMTIVNITIDPDNIFIDEVVVTALGMKREKKALGYSVQEVSGAEISESKELDVVNALSGKVAGVNITQGGGDLNGGGARIVIRGETSLVGKNTPLYIIDGIPGGSNDVASDDIESISILKGPAAAALYGSRAAAGVILITTKTGLNRKGKGIGVEVNSNTSIQTPFVLPDYQNQFGQGTGGIYQYYDGNNGVWPDGSISNDDYSINWGPAFDGELRPQFTGLDPWIAYPDNVRDFYETGLILNNNIAVSKAQEEGYFRLSYTNIRQKGIVPNTGVQTHRLDLSGGADLTERLNVTANIKYKNAAGDNTRSTDVRMYPRNIDIQALQDYWIPGLEGLQQMKWRSSSNNPYFEQYENTRAYTSNRLIGSTVLNYRLTDFISVMGRIGLVEDHGSNENHSAFSSVGANNQYGSFDLGKNRFYELNSDFLITFEKDLGESFNLKASAGGNHMQSEYSWMSSSVSQLLIPDVYNLGNHRVYPKTYNGYSTKILNSFYAFANLAWKKMIYLDVTARNDWSSTLPLDNNSYFYPSFALSSLMNNMFSLPDWISFWKIRGSWARVGNDTDPYQLHDPYSWGTGEGGMATIIQGNTSANPDLKPELTSAWEVGTDFRLFDNRLMLDVTYYNSVTTNQILKVWYSITTNFDFFYKNAGAIRNRGWEVMLEANMVHSTDFDWNMRLNWSRDIAFVEEYDPEYPDLFLSRHVTTHLFVEDRLGERRGAMYGKVFQRAPNGEMLFTKSGDTQRGERQYLGNYNPDWMASMYNNLSYKDLSLSFLLDLRFGGIFYSRTNYNLNIRGLSETTLLGGYDENGVYTPRQYIVPDGMIYEDGVYRELTREDLIESGLSSGGLTGQQYWENIMDEEIPEAVIYDATYLKFREISLSYKVPDRIISSTFIRSASVSLLMRNVAVWTKIPNVDPETFSGSQEAGAVLGYDSGGVPSVRNVAVNVNLRF